MQNEEYCGRFFPPKVLTEDIQEDIHILGGGRRRPHHQSFAGAFALRLLEGRVGRRKQQA